MNRPYIERWGDMRENCDQALKLAGMLPSAVRTAQDDPDFIEKVMVQLSDQLCCLDAHIGDERPDEPVTLERAVSLGKHGRPTKEEAEGKGDNDNLSQRGTSRDYITKKTGSIRLAPGQVDYITSLFHAATDAGCQLLITLTNDDREPALREGTIESLAQRVLNALWRIRWEMNIDAPGVDDDESEGDQ